MKENLDDFHMGPGPAKQPTAADVQRITKELTKGMNQAQTFEWMRNRIYNELEPKVATLEAELARVTEAATRYADMTYEHWNESWERYKAKRELRAALTAPPVAEIVARETLESVLRDVVAWGVQTFPKSTDKSKTAHLIKEAHELDANPCAEEMADVLMILAHLASAKGVNLADAVRQKLTTCKERVWAEPDTEGVVEHVREDSAIVQRRERERRAADLLAVILPMARGYAHANQVGANMQMIREAEEIVAAREDKFEPEIPGNSL